LVGKPNEYEDHDKPIYHATGGINCTSINSYTFA